MLVRPPAEESHYYSSDSGRVFQALLAHLADEERAQVVFSPRYAWQAAYLDEVDGATSRSSSASRCRSCALLNAVDAVVGSGGTMAREAAYLGLPSSASSREDRRSRPAVRRIRAAATARERGRPRAPGRRPPRTARTDRAERLAAGRDRRDGAGPGRATDTSRRASAPLADRASCEPDCTDTVSYVRDLWGGSGRWRAAGGGRAGRLGPDDGRDVASRPG